MVGTITSLPFPSALTGVQPRRADASTLQARSEENDSSAVLSDVSHSATIWRTQTADARSAVDVALAGGGKARLLLSDLRELTLRAADSATPDAARAAQDVAFRAGLQQIGQIADEVGGLLSGESVSLTDAATGETFQIAPLDLRLKSEAGEGDTLQISSDASLATPESAASAATAIAKSIARLDAGLERLSGQSDGLSLHAQLLDRLSSALGQPAADVNAEGARLLALQVRQDLAALNTPIANADPSGVLALFRQA
jgi:flagellin